MSLSLRLFEAKDIHRFLGIDKNKLFYWMKTYRLVTPVKEAEGTGTRSQFSFKNLLELAVVKELADLGYNLRTIQRLKKYLDTKRLSRIGDRVTDMDVFERILDWERGAEGGKALQINKKNNSYQMRYVHLDGVKGPDGRTSVVEEEIIFDDIKDPDFRPTSWIQIDLSEILRDLRDKE